ncbi:MAG: translation initiation factor IF-2 N-terminal domain-containing protein, partial [Nitrospiraceae bacterium]
MRVYELARKLGMENRDLVPELKRLGITVASHSSALDDPTAARVLEQLMPKPKPVSSTDGDKADDGGREAPKREMGKKKAGEALRGRRGQARESPKSVGVKPALVVSEEPPKADKKRILVKRQKVEEAIEPEGGVTPASPGAAFTPVVPTAPAAVESALILESQKAPPPPTMPAADVVGPASFVHPGPATQPQTLASAAPPVQPAPVVGPGEVRPEKKKGVTIGAPAAELTELRDKLRKLKKVGRGREEEDFKFREDAARWQDLRAIPVHRRDERSRHTATTSVAEITKPRKKIIKLTAGLTVKEFAELVGQRPADIVRKMMEVGHMLTLIQPMNLDAAVLLAEGFGLKAEIAAEKQPEELLDETAAVVEPE